MNLMGALRRSMATAGYSDLKEFQRVEVVVTPSSRRGPSPPRPPSPAPGEPGTGPSRPQAASGRWLPAGTVRNVNSGGNRKGHNGAAGPPSRAGVATALGPDKRAAALGDRERDAALAALAAQEHQVLVVGGGVVGAGVALDAATRGLSVGLVEARDFASGTSSRSSKLIHGGLRYLEQLNFGLVREALTERCAAAAADRAAPGPAGVVPVPVHPPRAGSAPTSAPGCGSTTLLGFSLGPGPGPARAPPADPARGAAAGARAEAVRAHRRAAVLGRAGGRRPVRDRRWSGPRPATARTVAVADPGHRLPARGRAGHRRARGRPGDPGPSWRSGPSRWSTRPGCGPTRSRPWSAGAARSTCARPRACTWSCPGTGSTSSTGIILRTPVSVLFVIPWGRHWIIGTTDTDWSLDKAHPAASRADIDYVLGQVNRVLAVPLTRDDVEGVYAGLRPLLAGESDDDVEAVARAHGRPPGAGPGDDRGRQVHHLPADGQGRGGRGRARPGRPGRRRPAPTRCRWPAPTAYLALWNSRYALARVLRPARGADRAPAAPVRRR